MTNLKHFLATILAVTLFVCMVVAITACQSSPFALMFTGVIGSYEGGNLNATMLLSGAEAKEGRINIVGDTSNITFRYDISADGKITFDFDDINATKTPDTTSGATGSLHGNYISVTANIGDKTYVFEGALYLLTEKTNGEITAEGYIAEKYPLSEVLNYPLDITSATVNGKIIAINDLLKENMPAKSTIIEYYTED